jgi:transcriptional regulator with XRE-family HTH domain
LTSIKVVLRHSTTKNNLLVNMLYKRVKTSTLDALYNHRGVVMGQLGKAIQVFRENAGLTQDELGERIGVSQQTIAKWEGGKSNPRPKALERLIKELRIDGQKLREMRISSTIDTFPYLATEVLAGMILNDPEINSPDAGRIQANLADVPKEFPGMLGSLANARVMREMIGSAVDAAEPTSEWNVVVRSQFGPWRVDYMNDELYAQFLHARTPRGLSGILSYNIYRYLWRYAMLGREPRSNKNCHLIIITYPEGNSLDIKDNNDERDGLSHSFFNENTLRRLTTEASLMGIYVMLARTPSKIVSILTNPSSIDDPGWDYPGPVGYGESD